MYTLSGTAFGQDFPFNKIDILIHPSIPEGTVNTSITLTCAAYYVNSDAFDVELDILWWVYNFMIY